MEAHHVPSEQHGHVVAAAIVIVGRVERLVQVADDVQQALLRQDVLRLDGGWIVQLGGDLPDLGYKTILCRSCTGGRARLRDAVVAIATELAPLGCYNLTINDTFMP